MSDEKKEKESNNFLNKIIDFIFSNDERKWLILIFLIALVLRFLVASNIAPLADESVHGPHAIGMLHSGLISTIVECPLWFYLTDLGLRILGVTFFSVRFLSFFYGSLTILLVYLLGSKVFNKKIGLISSFLLAISIFTIRFTLAEMDLSAAFFLILAVYSFILSSEKGKFPILAAVCIGLASSIKTLSLFFVPAFIIGFFLLNKRKVDAEKNYYKTIMKIIYFGLIILLFFSPILIHNYLLYKDKGIVDIYFSQYFNPNNSRAAYPDQGTTSFLSSNIFEGLLFMLKRFLKFDPIIFIIGILGIFLSFYKKEKREYLYFFVSFELSGFILLLIASNWLDYHYTTLFPLLCIFSSLFVVDLSNYLAKKIKIDYKKIIASILIIIFIFQIYMLLPYLTPKSSSSQLRNYAVTNLEKNSIVIADGRIYRGEIVWMFWDFHYLEANYFSLMLDMNANQSGNDVPTHIYFVECGIDDCGWGTIKNQPDFNKSMEDLVKAFSSAPLKKVITCGAGEPAGTCYNVYEAEINLKPQMLSIVDSTHDWYYYPVNYIPKERIFDRYSVNGAFDNLLYMFAWLVLISSIILAILFAVIPFFYLLKNREYAKE